MGGFLKKRFFRSGKQIQQQQNQEKERKEIETRYQIMRCDFDIDLLKIGIMEINMLEYKREGITPATKPLALNAEDAKAKEFYLRRVRKDMVRMVAEQLGVEVRPREDECSDCGEPISDDGKHSCAKPEQTTDGTTAPNVEVETKTDGEQGQVSQ